MPDSNVNNPVDERATFVGFGSFTPPDGMTAAEAQKLAEQADKERNQQWLSAT